MRGIAGGPNELSDQPGPGFTQIAAAVRRIERNRNQMPMHQKRTAPMGATGTLCGMSVQMQFYQWNATVAAGFQNPGGRAGRGKCRPQRIGRGRWCVCCHRAHCGGQHCTITGPETSKSAKPLAAGEQRKTSAAGVLFHLGVKAESGRSGEDQLPVTKDRCQRTAAPVARTRDILTRGANASRLPSMHPARTSGRARTSRKRRRSSQPLAQCNRPAKAPALRSPRAG